jgi:hypothetical protein
MRPDERVRFDDDDGIEQRWLPAIKPDEEPTVDGGEPELGRRSAPQDVELMPKERDLSLRLVRDLNGEARTCNSRSRNDDISIKPSSSQCLRPCGWSFR